MKGLLKKTPRCAATHCGAERPTKLLPYFSTWDKGRGGKWHETEQGHGPIREAQVFTRYRKGGERTGEHQHPSAGGVIGRCLTRSVRRGGSTTCGRGGRCGRSPSGRRKSGRRGRAG